MPALSPVNGELRFDIGANDNLPGLGEVDSAEVPIGKPLALQHDATDSGGHVVNGTGCQVWCPVTSELLSAVEMHGCPEIGRFG